MSISIEGSNLCNFANGSWINVIAIIIIKMLEIDDKPPPPFFFKEKHAHIKAVFKISTITIFLSNI